MKTTIKPMTRIEADLQMAIYALQMVAAAECVGENNTAPNNLSLCRQIAQGALAEIRTPLNLDGMLRATGQITIMN